MLKHFFALLPFLVLTIACKKEPAGPAPVPTPVVLRDTTMMNVSYGTQTTQVYDAYLPAGRTNTTPVILMIHGGAWKAGQKEDFNSYVSILKSKWPTVAIINMNYRLASNTNNIHHAEIMADIGAAVSQVTANAGTYGISTKMGLVGASAGGQLAMIYAYRYNSSIKCVGNIFGPSIINDWSWYNTTNLWLGAYTGSILAEYVGQTWDSAAYKAVSPYWNVSTTTQPTILFHGSLDPIVPVYQSQWMNGRLSTFGVPHTYHEYLAFHGFDTAQSDDVLNKLVAFFKLHI